MKLLDGKELAAKSRRELKRHKFSKALAAILVGKDPTSILYLKKKADLAQELGVKFVLKQLPASASQMRVLAQIQELNKDSKVGGIIVQLPLPKRLDTNVVVNAIDPDKDVDGLTDVNITSGKMLPATAVGILRLLNSYRISYRRKRVVLVGFTRLLNVPLSVYLANLGNRITVLQKGSKQMRDLKEADIIITAAGQPGLIRGKDVKEGVVVVDAGIARQGKRVVGDVDVKTVAKKAKWLTPVPGGVGPMTVIGLFLNLKKLQ